MKNKIGLIAMGSRENRPNWQDLIARLEPELEVDMVGVLDGLIQEEIEDRFSYRPGENYIVTEMPWDYSRPHQRGKGKGRSAAPGPAAVRGGRPHGAGAVYRRF